MNHPMIARISVTSFLCLFFCPFSYAQYEKPSPGKEFSPVAFWDVESGIRFSQKFRNSSGEVISGGNTLSLGTSYGYFISPNFSTALRFQVSKDLDLSSPYRFDIGIRSRYYLPLNNGVISLYGELDLGYLWRTELPRYTFPRALEPKEAFYAELGAGIRIRPNKGTISIELGVKEIQIGRTAPGLGGINARPFVGLNFLLKK